MAAPPKEFNVVITGQEGAAGVDLYHRVLEAPWWQVLLAAFVAYLVVSALFAGTYLIDPACVHGVEEPMDAFWFSVQTLSTIGYGAMTPATPLAHVLVTLESFTGLVAVAMGTGIMFAKFSRPTAKVKFSESLVTTSFDGVPTLMFRMANERRNQIVEARLNISALMDEVSSEGHSMRRLKHLRLENDRTPAFSLTWTAMHRMDRSSPLYDLHKPEVMERVVALVVTFTGQDDTFHQTVHARHTYFPRHVAMNHRFVDMVETRKDGPTIIHCERLHEIVPDDTLEPRDLASAGLSSTEKRH